MWRTCDVGEVVDLLGGDAQVVAGKAGLGRQVSRAKVAANADLVGRAGSNELLVTTSEALGSVDDGWDLLFGSLDVAGVAGLGVCLNTSGDLPAGLVSAANGQRMPVGVFAGGDEQVAVTGGVPAARLEARERRR
ncbi:MAG TPA: hypothetical protein DEG13_12760, partial [Candidatus Microthrix parvicella]|nr:hypothetical protein [Candidatus Microthrix parvicella]